MAAKDNGQARPGYMLLADPEQAELDSDVWAVLVDHVVSVTPLSLDLTSRVELGALHACLHGKSTACLDAPKPCPFPVMDPRPVAVP